MLGLQDDNVLLQEIKITMVSPRNKKKYIPGRHPTPISKPTTNIYYGMDRIYNINGIYYPSPSVRISAHVPPEIPMVNPDPNRCAIFFGIFIQVYKSNTWSSIPLNYLLTTVYHAFIT